MPQDNSNTVKLRLSELFCVGLSLAVLPGFLLGGCGQRQGTYLGGRRTSQIGTVSKEQLTERLETFADTTKELLLETSQTLRVLDPEIGSRRADVVRSLRFTHALHVMLDHGDPMVALLETWTLTIRMKDYFKTGYGRNLYGEHQAIAVDAVERLEANVEGIGRDILTGPEFEETRQEVQSFASRNPLNESLSNLLVYATETQSGEPSPFADALSIPLSPFTAMKGVDRTASAIYGVKDSVKRTADVVEGLPESARWQLLLLLTDMEEADVVKSFLTSASTFSQSSARLAKTAEELPAELRAQAALLVKDLDESQANLQQTLDKTKETAAALDHSLTEARTTMATLEQTTNAVTTTAEQWHSAATATEAVIAAVREWRGSATKKPMEKSTTIQDYQETIRDVTEASDRLQGLIASAHNLVESGAVKARIDEVQGSAEALVDHIAWRLLQLVGVIALIVAVFRFTAARSAKRQVISRHMAGDTRMET